MKLIPLTQGKFAQVDDEDFECLSKHKWYARKARKYFYAGRAIYIDKKQKIIWMHREIMNTPENMQVDHVFHNTLDNRKFIKINNELKCNLRNCNHAENCRNRTASGASRYLGVFFYVRKYKKLVYKYPIAQIHINGEKTYLGSFKTEEEAAFAYDKAAKEYYGEFANLNFK